MSNGEVIKKKKKKEKSLAENGGEELAELNDSEQSSAKAATKKKNKKKNKIKSTSEESNGFTGLNDETPAKKKKKKSMSSGASVSSGSSLKSGSSIKKKKSLDSGASVSSAGSLKSGKAISSRSPNISRNSSNKETNKPKKRQSLSNSSSPKEKANVKQESMKLPKQYSTRLRSSASEDSADEITRVVRRSSSDEPIRRVMRSSSGELTPSRRKGTGAPSERGMLRHGSMPLHTTRRDGRRIRLGSIDEHETTKTAPRSPGSLSSRDLNRPRSPRSLSSRDLCSPRSPGSNAGQILGRGGRVSVRAKSEMTLSSKSGEAGNARNSFNNVGARRSPGSTRELVGSPRSPGNLARSPGSNRRLIGRGGRSAARAKSEILTSSNNEQSDPRLSSRKLIGRGGRGSSSRHLNGRGRGRGRSGPGVRAMSMMDLKQRPGDSSGTPPTSRNRAPPPQSKSGSLENMRREPPQRLKPTRTRSADFDFSSLSNGPKSILRNSSHHSRNNNQHVLRQPQRRPSADGLPVNSVTVSDHQEIVDDEEVSIEEVAINFESRKPLKRGKSLLDISAHSMMTTRSQLSADRQTRVFENDPPYKMVLRYLRILPPYPDEKPNKKWIRRYTWWALVLDFIASMVSITTYNGVTTCCGVPIYSVAANINWDKTIRITTYVYVALIFCEIIPVLHKGIPFNLINPLVGFTIFFAMFFDDRAFEAICMWIIESSAIVLEFMVYRIKSKIYHEREDRLVKVDQDLEAFKVEKRNKSKRLISMESDSDDSLSGDSFDGVEDQRSKSDGSDPSFGGNNPKLKEMRWLRERRLLRETQKQARVELRYHFIGVCMNFALVGISLTLVIVIAKNKGVCFVNMQPPKIFSNDQLESCYLCKDHDEDGACEECMDDGTSQCYYPYY